MKRGWMGSVLVAVSMAGLVLASVVVANDADAVDLRRPYAESIALGYGFDNDGGAGGCTDYSCGGTCYDGHTGSDFPLPLGTNVLAGADGTVIATNNGCANYGGLGNTCGGRCGNYVKLRHADGDTTIYCHMRKDSLQVSNGETVSCGQVLGQSASSGSSTGPHLHLGWSPGGGASRDVYAGQCTSSPGAWRQQNAKTAPPGASCGCVASTEVCDGVDNDCDGDVDEGDVCEIELLLDAPNAYAPAKTSDVDGDGIQDVCARFYGGYRCYALAGSGWEQSADSTLMAEENGWGAPKYYATIRMGDVDGDGLADVCARHSGGFSCWRSTGEQFEDFATHSSWSNDGGWDQPRYYTTIRLADIDGDGRDDICARGASGWRCHRSTGDGFGPSIEGPEWSNAAGFDRARYYGSIRTGDVDGDGLEDVCMREPDGFACYRSTGDGFEHLTTNTGMRDDSGWGKKIYWPSIRLADIDGDGSMDLCGRDSRSLFCRRFDGEKFGAKLELGALSNDTGWSDPTNYATLRAADITGDGSDELCIRANAKMLCYRVDGDSVSRFGGPVWSDAAGWDAPASHGPIFATNLDAEARGALCGRSPDGLTCAQYADGGFVDYPRFDEFTDDGGWDVRKYYSTIRMGQGSCRAGLCDADEPEPGDAGGDAGADAGSDAGSDTGGYGQDDAGHSGSDDAGGPGDIGNLADAGQTQESGSTRVASTSSCAAAPGGRPMGLIWLVLGSALVLLWRANRRLQPTGRFAAAMLVMGAIALVACNRPASTADETATSQEPETTAHASTAVEPAPAGPHDDHEVLAIHGKWRVVGEPVAQPARSDGPPRYRPALLVDGESVEWPLEREMVSEVWLVGEAPTLVALGVDGTLVEMSLDGSNKTQKPMVIDHEVSSQVSAAADGCCVAYIREHSGGQTLHVHELHNSELGQVELGHALGWAPAVSKGGEKVAWTASPHGFPSVALAHTNHKNGEPRLIVNGEEDRTAEELDPFPNGAHAPIWTPDGIAFQAGNTLRLIDERGKPLGSADASNGMFWDGASGELVDARGEGIVWETGQN